MSAPSYGTFYDYNMRKIASGFCNCGWVWKKSDLVRMMLQAANNIPEDISDPDMEEGRGFKVHRHIKDWKKEWYHFEAYGEIRRRSVLLEEYKKINST